MRDELEAEKILKKIEKTFQKPIDKRLKMWYNNKVGAEKRAAHDLDLVKNFLKKFQKRY